MREGATKVPCRCATAADITLNGLQTVNGVVLVEGDRVVVRCQTDPLENGIYLASASAWVRAYDFNGDEVETGTLVWAREGLLRGWYEVTTLAPRVGSTSIDWRHWVLREAISSPIFSAGASTGEVIGTSTGDGTISASGFSVVGLIGESLFAGAMSASGVGSASAEALLGALSASGGSDGVVVGSLVWAGDMSSAGLSVATGG